MSKRLSAYLFLCLMTAAPAAAQEKDPIGPIAVDLRGAFARHKVEPDIAKNLSVEAGNLPVRSFGLVGGAHIYPWRTRGKVMLGFGGNVVVARGTRTLDVVASDGTTTKSPTVRRYFTTFSPEISLNFGHRNGWSYISGGLFGRSKLYVDLADKPAAEAPYRKTLNYGGGARWFTSEHVAFAVDFRWYSVAEQLAVAGVVGQPRTTLLVLSGGLSFK